MFELMKKEIKKGVDKVKKWAKNKAAIASIAMASVEKDMLGQNGSRIGSESNHVRRITQGTLMDALINGEMTQEVMELRDRVYRVIREGEKRKRTIIGFKTMEDGEEVPIFGEEVAIDPVKALTHVTVEPSDRYPLELVIPNNTITLSIKESLVGVQLSDKVVLTKDEEGKPVALHGNINGMSKFGLQRGEKPLIITRTFYPKFSLENFTTKLHVRDIDGDKKLLEFYVSKYPIDEDRNTHLFIKEVEKAIKNPMASNMLDMKEVEFITYGATGQFDFFKYAYSITGFDKIVEFRGEYVIKFHANVTINAEDTTEKYLLKEMSEKYEKKTRKK